MTLRSSLRQRARYSSAVLLSSGSGIKASQPVHSSAPSISGNGSSGGEHTGWQRGSAGGEHRQQDSWGALKAGEVSFVCCRRHEHWQWAAQLQQ